jgi:hypothetical protein
LRRGGGGRQKKFSPKKFFGRQILHSHPPCLVLLATALILIPLLYHTRGGMLKNV